MSTLRVANKAVVPVDCSRGLTLAAQRPGLRGSPDCVRSRVWIWLSSSIENITAWGRLSDIGTDDVRLAPRPAIIARALESPQAIRLQ